MRASCVSVHAGRALGKVGWTGRRRPEYNAPPSPTLTVLAAVAIQTLHALP